jgi:hypothetical protein
MFLLRSGLRARSKPASAAGTHSAGCNDDAWAGILLQIGYRHQMVCVARHRGKLLAVKAGPVDG